MGTASEGSEARRGGLGVLEAEERTCEGEGLGPHLEKQAKMQV